jgi:hypothetical protein
MPVWIRNNGHRTAAVARATYQRVEVVVRIAPYHPGSMSNERTRAIATDVIARASLSLFAAGVGPAFVSRP